MRKNDYYKETDFERCIFNPMNKLDMLTAYPKLATIVKTEWFDDDSLDAILRYIVCMYDPKSPLIKDENDLHARKGIAAEVAQMREEIREEVYALVYPVEEEFKNLPDLIFYYLKRFGRSKEFAAIIAMEFKFWEQIQQLLQPITGKDSKQQLEAVQKKSIVANEIELDMKKIETYYKSFFGDPDLERKVRKRMTPEEISDVVKE